MLCIKLSNSLSFECSNDRFDQASVMEITPARRPVISVSSNPTVSCNLAGANVTVNRTGTTLAGPSNAHLPGRVLVTPLSSTASSFHNIIIKKILLKAVTKSSKKDPKTFMLRDVNINSIVTCDQLKQLIKSQLSRDLVKEFDVGYYDGSTVVSIRSAQDLGEIWSDLKRGSKVILWCDGLREFKTSSSRKRKRLQSSESESEDESRCKSGKKKSSVSSERESKVEEAVKTLQESHGNKYTQIQYRIWAEMYTSGFHKSLQDPPTNSMFVKAGNGEKPTKGKGMAISEAFIQMARDISTALSPASASCGKPPPTSSPGRLIDARSKCYKQLSELHNLKSSGILSEEEYLVEKSAVMANLKLL